MAYDVFKGSCCGRDWSCGAGEAEGVKAEVWTVPQISALGDVVEREVNHNLAMCNKRLKAGTLDKAEGEEFAKFARGWRDWKAREMGKGKALTGLVVDKLKQWRSDNAGWTSKLSETARGSLVVMRSMAIIVAKPKPQRMKMLAGALGVFGLGWLVGRRS